LQNITIDNIYIFASIVSINLKTLIDIFTINFLFKFNSFVAIFSSILYCYLNNIFYSKLNIKNIIRFIVNLFFVVATNIVDSSNARSFLDLLCTFDIYIFITLANRDNSSRELLAIRGSRSRCAHVLVLEFY